MTSKSEILVIDDNIDIANIVKLMLENDGYNVNVFDDPFLALEYFKSNSNENALVITDVRMPGMSGPELVARIKRIKPETKIIFMTAFDISSVKPEMEKYDYEVAEIFQKPMLMRTLRNFVNKILPNATDAKKT
ncbi:MAG: response regulator [Candidatus Nitrosocosmicus sp.]